MPLCWARVDDRLIHGQVVVAWRRYLRYDAIYVVDDAVGADPFLCDALHLAAPAGITVRVCTTKEAADVLATPLSGKVLLLFRCPQAALALVEGGWALSHLNVGNLAARPGSKRIHRSTSLTSEHVIVLDALASRGVRITFQSTPDELALDWHSLRQRYS